MIQKNRFFYKLFHPFVSVLVGCFLDTLTFFVERSTKMLKLQNRWSNVTFFKKKNNFPQKIPPDTRIAVETNWEKIYRPSVFWIKLQRSVEESEKFQICFFPQKLPRIPRLRVSKIWRTFLLERKKLLRIGKNSECLSFEKKFKYCSSGHLLLFCQPW